MSIRSIFMILFMIGGLVLRVHGDVLAYWDFGPDGDGYSESPAIDSGATASTFVMTVNAGSSKDSNGKDGVDFTDSAGVFHAAGQAAAWSETADNAGDWTVTVNATDKQITQVRWDAYTDDAGGSKGPTSFALSYTINGGISWIAITNGAVFQRDGEKAAYYAYEYDVSTNTALQRNADVRFKVHALAGGTLGSCGFDNIMISSVSAAEDTPPSVTLNPAYFVYYVRPGDVVQFDVRAVEIDGDAVSLVAESLPAGAVFTNQSGPAPLSSTFSWETDTSGTYSIPFVASDKNGEDRRAVTIYVMRDRCALQLNEANAVGASSPTLDSWFVEATGNGGNWMELVVLEDHLDVRGWTVKWAETGDSANFPRDIWYGDADVSQGVITLANQTNWADLRAGTILTLIEYPATNQFGSTVTDLTMNPASDDWWINVCTKEEAFAGGRYATTDCNDVGFPSGEFSVGNDGWFMCIYDAEGIMVAPPIGEGINGCEVAVGTTELLALDAGFDSGLTEGSAYKDMDISSFGVLNEIVSSTGERQDPTWARAWNVFTNTESLIINEAYAGGTNAWLELLVQQDHLDLRGSSLKWLEEGATFESDGSAPVNGQTSQLQGVLTFSTNDLWMDVRAGTTITVSSDVRMVDDATNVLFNGSDVSYRPTSGDFWIHISSQAEATNAAPYLTAVDNDAQSPAGSFSIGSADWQMTWYDAGGHSAFGPVGEKYMESAVSALEYIRLESEITDATPYEYDDAAGDSFGLPNPLAGSSEEQQWNVLQEQVDTPSIVLNEYNVTRSGQYLKNDGSDAFFGRIAGNGGNWLEWLVLSDHVDIRGWRIQWAELEGDLGNGSVIWYPDGTVKQGELCFGQSMWLADVRAGTLLTVIETDVDGVADTDVAVNPIGTNWLMRICTENEVLKSNPLITTQINQTNDVTPGTFAVGHESWVVRLLDAQSNLVFGTFGESEMPLMQLSYDEVARREADELDVSWIKWDDAGSSTFGSLNVWGSHTQTVASVRSWFPGDDALDQDDDGLPDAWEIEKLGSTAAQPQVDVDGDTFDNEAEYVAGTLPADASSYFSSILQSLSPPSMLLYAVSGRVYQVESTGSLDTEWVVVVPEFQATNAWITVELPLNDAPAFYRTTVALP